MVIWLVPVALALPETRLSRRACACAAAAAARAENPQARRKRLIPRCALWRLHHLFVGEWLEIALVALGHLLVAREALGIAIQGADAG